jgi:arabinan endo-1,5-alpha-L-arabinosidase
MARRASIGIPSLLGRLIQSLFLFLSLARGNAAAQSAVNPLQGDLGVHDPAVIPIGTAYATYYTGNGIAIKTSPDRITWRNGGAVFSSNPAWHKTYVPEAGASLWAPDISFRAGKYWLYYSVSTFGSNVSAIGLATAPTLDAAGKGAWADQGMVVRSVAADDYNAIDPNAAVEADGTPWLAFGSFWSGIQLIRLDPATGKPASDAKQIRLATHSGGIEAPFLFRRDPYWYLFVSWDKCCQGAASTYNIRVGRSAKIDGPYADSRGTAMLQGGGDLIDDGDARWKGPGHNAVFADHDTAFLANHAYDADNAGKSILWIRPLYWSKEGWPGLEPAGTVGLGRPAAKQARLSGRVRDRDWAGRKKAVF